MVVNLSMIQAVRGMNDVLPEATRVWQAVEGSIRVLLSRYGYDEIRTPIVESLNLFCRSVGEVTDMVEKEMYAFADRNGDQLALRPEGTASCVRACVEHGILHAGPARLWYMGPMFRHERPQKGRYRQFVQLGVEAFGLEGPDVDAEHLEMMARFWQELGLSDKISLQINSIGDLPERQQYNAALVEYFSRYEADLDDDSRRRLLKNPLRILDSKNPAMAGLIQGAPVFSDYISSEAISHFEGVCELLTQVGIPYVHNTRLVRGIDYYDRTVYEWVTDALGAQGTVCAGGRYNGLVAELGGKPTPAVGFSMGLERILALWEMAHPQPEKKVDLCVILLGEVASRMGFQKVKMWRDHPANWSILLQCGEGSLKSQMKKADKSGARWALIMGDHEVEGKVVALKDLREQKPQVLVPWSEMDAWLGNNKA